MNRAQKNAWFGLAICLLAIVFCFSFVFGRIFFSVPVPAFKAAPPIPGFKLPLPPSQTEIIIKNILRFGPLVLIPVTALLLLLIPRKKQSPAEPDFDELDAAIQNKATRVSFFSIWLMWPLVLILTTPMLGEAAHSIAIFCVFIYLGVFIVCMAIYFLTKVILYKKQTEGDTV